MCVVGGGGGGVEGRFKVILVDHFNSGLEFLKKSCSTQMRTKLQLLIKTKMLKKLFLLSKSQMFYISC